MRTILDPKKYTLKKVKLNVIGTQEESKIKEKVPLIPPSPGDKKGKLEYEIIILETDINHRIKVFNSRNSREKSLLEEKKEELKKLKEKLESLL